MSELVQNHLCPSKNYLKPEAICVSPVSAGKTSFLDINEISNGIFVILIHYA